MSRLNPNPITKLIATLMLSLNLTFISDEIYSYMSVIVYVSFYFILGDRKQALKTTIFFTIVSLFVHYIKPEVNDPMLAMLVTLVVVIKVFYLPMMAGRFLVKTTDVGSIVSAMDKVKVPKSLSIPIAVIFRFWPSFREEHKNIAFAMKMRGISKKKPAKYFEYVMVPLLTISSDIADDIAIYAETKALADPCDKVRYTNVTFGIGDILFILPLVAIQVVSRL